MGVFADYQPQYAEHGVATFPVHDVDKRPAIKQPQRVGISGSRMLAAKFGANNALGFWTGPRNNLTVLDVDVPDERVLADRLDRHGQTPFVVRTGGGKFHAYYRHNGERRIIREGGESVDILGSAGFALAAPSRLTRGDYAIIQGRLDDLDRLPKMRGLPADAYEWSAAAPAMAVERVNQGARNRTVWRHCMRAARHCDDLDALIDVARTFNDDVCIPALADGEVVSIARSAWDYEERGLNRFGRGRTVMVSHDNVDHLAASNPDAFALLCILRRYHSDRSEFVLSKNMANDMGWRLPRWKHARKSLADAGFIRCIHLGGRGPHDPPRYGWAKGYDFVPQSKQTSSLPASGARGRG